VAREGRLTFGSRSRVQKFRGSKVVLSSPQVILQTFCTGKPTASTFPQTWNMVFVNYVAKPAFLTRT
jgi:hypothetical protein